MTNDCVTSVNIWTKFLTKTKFARQQPLCTYKPLLAEVIDSTEAHARRRGRPAPYYNIETKLTPAGDGVLHPAPEEFVQLLLPVIRAKGIQDRAIISVLRPPLVGSGAPPAA